MFTVSEGAQDSSLMTHYSSKWATINKVSGTRTELGWRYF